MIPAQASLSVYDTLAPHLSNRRDLYVFPQIEEAEYVFLDLEAIEEMRQSNVLDLTTHLNELLSNGQYEYILERYGYLILHRWTSE